MVRHPGGWIRGDWHRECSLVRRSLFKFARGVLRRPMSRIWSFLLGMAVGALLLYTAMNFHILRSRDGFHLVVKRPARLSESYVDIREFSMADWTAHPQIATALVQANKQHLLGDSASSAIHQSLNQLLPERQRQ